MEEFKINLTDNQIKELRKPKNKFRVSVEVIGEQNTIILKKENIQK